MKRTLLAVGVAVLVSLMLVPRGYHTEYYASSVQARLPFFLDSNWAILSEPFVLQTIFLSVLAAVIVNLFPRRKKN